MALSPPVLPQIIDGVITTAAIAADSGIIVDVPTYTGLRAGDTIGIYYNNNLIATFNVTNPTQLPRRFIIPSDRTAPGSGTVFYRSTDSSGNPSNSELVSFSVVQNPAVSSYTLSGNITANGVIANGIQENQITYILSSSTSQPVAGQFITFEAVPSAGVILSAPFGTTNANGLVSLSIRSTVAQNVLIIARLAVDTSVVSALQVNFIAAPVSYQLTLSNFVNDSPANGEAINIVRARLVNNATQAGVSNQALTVYVNGPASYPGNVITNNVGEANIYITSSVAGSLTVTVVLQSNNNINSTINTTFGTGYPISLPAFNVWVGIYVPMNNFLRIYNLIEGHRYYLSTTRTPTSIHNCNPTFAFNLVNNSYVCQQGLGNDLIYLNAGIQWFKPLRSGPGEFFYSERYPYFNSAGYSVVQLIDYGPDSSLAALPPNDYQYASIPADPAESIEFAETIDPGDPEADDEAPASQ